VRSSYARLVKRVYEEDGEDDGEFGDSELERFKLDE
jgi:hypothetical protein